MEFKKGDAIFWYHNDEIKKFYMAVTSKSYTKMLCVVEKQFDKRQRVDCDLKKFIRKDRGKFFTTFDECWKFAKSDIHLRMSKLKGLSARIDNLTEVDLD